MSAFTLNFDTNKVYLGAEIKALLRRHVDDGLIAAANKIVQVLVDENLAVVCDNCYAVSHGSTFRCSGCGKVWPIPDVEVYVKVTVSGDADRVKSVDWSHLGEKAMLDVAAIRLAIVPMPVLAGADRHVADHVRQMYANLVALVTPFFREES